MQSFRFANQMYVERGAWVCMCMRLCVCVRSQCGDGGSLSSVRTVVHTAGVQLPSRGWAGPRWRGQGTKGSGSTYLQG